MNRAGKRKNTDYKEAYSQEIMKNTILAEELARMKEGLGKIVEFQMPRLRIKDNDVSMATVSELCMCIQDMAGIAKQALTQSIKMKNGSIIARNGKNELKGFK